MTSMAEAKGLYALLCLCESRKQARRTPEGAYVPLDEQDCRLWDHDLILEAEKALWMAARAEQPGVYPMEAAIHSIHAHRARSGHTASRLVARTRWTRRRSGRGVRAGDRPQR